MKHLVFAFFLTILTTLASSCTKTDPHPELRDEIYKDLATELGIATKALEDEEKSLLSLRGELSKAVPQTGQIKYATLKVHKSEELVNKMLQQKIYFEVKMERRKVYVMDRYIESLRKNGRKWPDQEEIDIYKSVTKFNREKIEFDKNKRMVKGKDVPRGTKVESGDPKSK
jgi:hypothetical protein